jgi:uncharacterized protein YciI
MRITLSIVSLLLCFFGSGICETESSKYDAKLAKELGADEMGMKQYVLVILKTGPNDASIKGKEREEAFAGHMANIGRLAQEKKLAVAGPFGKNDFQYRGLFIFNVTTVEEARQLAETDPAVKAGIFIVDFIPWYGSAALMATDEIHKKISKR